MDLLSPTDGKILVADGSGIWRLNTNGSTDTTFQVGALNGGTNTVAVQSGGKIIVAGYF